VPVAFDKSTKPFKPLEQLMAVFPCQSRKFLPIEWQSLMMEKQSPIIDFYPLNFSVDLNGKRYEWQGVALLPFVDEKRLHRTLEHVYSTLSNDEQRRNRRDYDRLYVHTTNLCYDYFKQLYNQVDNEITRKTPLDMPSMLSGGMAGRIWPDDSHMVESIGEKINAPLPNCDNIDDNQVICVKYRDLLFDDDYVFKAKLLENARLPDATLKPRDYDQRTPYRPNMGFAQQQHFPRDFAPAQRFIQHSIGGQGPYRQQQPAGYFADRQQGQYNAYNNHRAQSYSSQSNYRQQQYQTDYSAPRHNFRPRTGAHHQQRPYNNYNNNYRPNMNGGGSWS
jgi:5'-3' exonuclease